MSDFVNRLRKNARHWGKWARRRGISCYRLYDRDLPDYPVAIDLYEQRVHVQEYERAWHADEEAYVHWHRSVSAAVQEVLEVPASAVAFKRRRRQSGKAQYEKAAQAGEAFVVNEHGHRFLVNLDTYLDTGLFLDHRNARAMIQARARDKRFLNLFSYTGSFTVYAAAGGASCSTTVDLSNTYLNWAQRNFALNGLDPAVHELVRANVFEFLPAALRDGRQYDLIVMDPPSFSNSKAMTGVLDVQRDHVRLIEACMRLLSAEGELLFSTNRRGVKLDEAALKAHRYQEISHLTLPEDFRDKKLHRAWLFSRG